MFKTIKIDPIVDELKRVKGNQLSLTIDKFGKVCISAPHYASIADINGFVDYKRKWIEKHKSKILLNKPLVRNFDDGEEFYYLGKPLKIRYEPNYKYAINFVKDEFVLSSKAKPKARIYLESLYKNLAWNYFAPRINELAKLHNFKFKVLKISSAKGKWGSCSSSGNINLSWRLLMSPPKSIEYVIIHELAHTIEPNHSSRFWAIVKEKMPDYEIHKQWLKDNSRLCDF